MNQEDNQRAALEAARAETRQAGSTEPDSGTPGWFLGIVVVLVVGGLLVFLAKSDPCVTQRVKWWVNSSGDMRSCAFAAKCSINDGSMPHVAEGEGFIWFDDSAPAVCQGVKF